MTTSQWNRRAGPIAQAMNKAYELAAAGNKAGTFSCPKCGSTVRFTCLGQPHQHRGHCTAASCGVRWAT